MLFWVDCWWLDCLGVLVLGGLFLCTLICEFVLWGFGVESILGLLISGFCVVVVPW